MLLQGSTSSSPLSSLCHNLAILTVRMQEERSRPVPGNDSKRHQLPKGIERESISFFLFIKILFLIKFNIFYLCPKWKQL
jgi:hypothetical protein